ncbi:hypothetical protein LOCC1_G002816 [Lachnellula occidentalis]|uniref:Uncharacterized protein n=1 Tax=Lachnellula occidentalis TaxID=215460 RepID=A0A8H8S4D1_9HELO|nr:hypothetical protein LOCC1_G002816 [Lachnellula occidentalis]
MNEIEDELRPSKVDIQRIYAQSSQRWSSHARESYLQSGFSPESLRLRNMLGNVPAYLGHNLDAFREQSNKPEFDLHTKAVSDGLSVLYVSGESLWSVGEGNCDLKEKAMPDQIILGVQKSISCSFSDDDRFANWPEFHEHHKTQSKDGNCLAILVFAWLYVLSARWVEMQQTSGTCAAQSNERMVYLCHQAEWRDDTSESLLDTIDINLGVVSNDAARWWAAILAKDEGWRAEIERNDSVYRAPWSTTSISAEYQFRLRRASISQNSFDSVSSPPPSSDVAVGYLTDFYLLHNAGSQCSAALAAALTFPFLEKASLPLPTSHDACVRTQIATANISSRSRSSPSPPSSYVDEKDEILQDFRLLPYYMTLSCSRRGIESLLCNTFFDPHIPCNLVGAWIQPIFEVLDPLIANKDYKVLAMVLGRQQPKVAALWTGAIITGMERSILQHCRHGFIAIDILAAAWTNTTQTFLSLDPQPLPDYDRIYRADECRLLYLAGEELNSRIPICPWRPFGTTALSDTDICVRTHANCAGGHYLRYASWSWVLKNGANVRDPGFCCSDTTKHSICTTVDDSIIPDKYKEIALVNETISTMATRSIFGWLRSYGWPAAEKVIYSHSWLSEGSDDESDIGSKDDTSDPGKGKFTSDKFEIITTWLDQCAKEFEATTRH